MAFYYGTGGGSPPARRPTGYYPPPDLSGVGYNPATQTVAPIPPPPGPAAPSAPSAPSAPAQPAFNLGSLDFSNDPVLARIRALGQESIAQAEAEATAARTRLVIGYGDPKLAGRLGLSSKIQSQAKKNTFGTLQELKRGYKRRNVFDIDRPLSDRANLFYSTERGRQHALSGEQYLRDQSQAEAAIQERLATISSSLTQARMAAQAQQISAEQDAYNRALQRALYAAGAA